MATEKIQSQSLLESLIKSERSRGKVIGFTNGCFDVLHPGHVKYLAEARGECDLLVVGVNSDASVRSIKGPSRPVNDQAARMEVLAALGCVDYVTLFDEDTPENLIRKLGPDVIFKGGDWDEKDIAGAEYVKKSGGKVRVIPYVKGYSTTDLIERLRESAG